MHHKFLFVFFLLFGLNASAQIILDDDMRMNNNGNNGYNYEGNNQYDPNNPNKYNDQKSTKADSVAPITEYRKITHQNDTIVIDTTINIKRFYKFNYTRKDLFGLLPLSNEGQSFNVLKHNYKKPDFLPRIGFNAKNYGYWEEEDIPYYHVPTAYSELFYNVGVNKGHNVDAMITLNINENINILLGYNGLRSLGEYSYELSSFGRFKLGLAYHTTNKRYKMRLHFTRQEIFNEENGGIKTLTQFTDSKRPYDNRQRIDVYFNDINTNYAGKRVYLNQELALNSDKNLALIHTLKYETKYFEFVEQNVNSLNDTILRYGYSFKAEIKDTTNYHSFRNRLGLVYKTGNLGHLQLFSDYVKDKIYYKSVAMINNEFIPSSHQNKIFLVGASYGINRDKFKVNATYNTAVSGNSTNEFEASVQYDILDGYSVKGRYRFLNRLPDMYFNLFQSSFKEYNWKKNFKNEKSQSIEAGLDTPYGNIIATYQNLRDKLYFSNNYTNLNEYNIPYMVLISPKQYTEDINYFSLQYDMDFKFWKLNLDNSILYQKVEQNQNILNVPDCVLRSTLYYTDRFFNKALGIQAGLQFSYFSSYFANDYNSILGDFFIQDKIKVGNYPVIDFFVNMKIQTARIYLKWEHINSSFSGYKYYSTPNQPYRDFTFRYGIVWNFFT